MPPAPSARPAQRLPRPVREARRLLRRAGRERAGRFLVEGPQAVREALAAPGAVHGVFVEPAAAARHPELLAAALARGVRVHHADPATLAALSETITPQGLVAVADLVGIGLDRLLDRRPRLVAVLAAVRDPGNAGTVLRCADAAGADGAVLTSGCVDVHNGKAVRASAGSLFHLPVAVGVDPAAAVVGLRRAGLTVLAADGAATVDLDAAEAAGLLSGRHAWLFGNEARGLPDEVATLADEVVAVPIYGRAESLNLATAAAVCLYSSARVQRAPGGCRARPRPPGA